MRNTARVLLAASSFISALPSCSDATSGGGSSGTGGSTSPGAGGLAGSSGTAGASASGGLGAGGAGTSGGAFGSGGEVAIGGATSSGGTAGAAGSGGVSSLPDAGASGASGASGAGGASSSSPILGAYCGNDVGAVQAFESWLGRPVDGILGYTGAASWTDYDGSVGWAANLWRAIDRRVLWSVPLIPTGATLSAAAAGDYDDHYRKAAQTLAAYRPGDAQVYVRTGWEFNGDWFPWTAKGDPSGYAAAFQRFVTVFRSVSSRFVFEWNVNVGDTGMNPEDAYPGDAYVDIIGMDFYWNTQYDPTDPVKAWQAKVSETYGLQWHQDFAMTHGKPTAYSEWGVESDAAAYYIQQAKAWFDAHHVVYQTYWNSNVAFQGELSGGQYPNAAAAYKTAFGP